MSIRHHLGLTMLALCMQLAATPVQAQPDRDPTVAPGESQATPQMPAGVEGMTVMARDGKPYLVVGTRWYAVGDKVGIMRVDRISETEIWLHDGVKLNKIPRFAGIVRTTVATKPVCAPAPIPVTVAPTADVPQPLSDYALRAVGNARNDRTALDAPAPKRVKNKDKTSKKATTGVVDPAANPLPAVAPCEDTPS